MSNKLILKDCSYFSDDRVKGINVSKNNFVSTDSLLQNKGGVGNPVSLPNGNLISFKCDDILVGNIRPYLKKIWFSTKNGGCSPDVLVFRANSNVNPKFLYYALFRDDFFIHMMKGAKGTKMPRGDKNQIMRFEIPKFDITYQQKIASVLSALDSKIELNNRINAELEAMAKTIYDYWFVQFEFPIEAALAAKMGDPNLIGKPYKTNGGKMVWNEALKREIPEGWEVKLFGDAVTIKNGRDHKHLNNGNYPVYGSGGVMRQCDTFLYNSESILIPRKGSLGNLFYINEPFWCVDTIFYTQMKYPQSCKYLFYTTQNFNIAKMNTGTAVPSMTTEILNNLTLIFPPLNILKSFDDILTPIFKKKSKTKIENQKLAELRDWLLPMLMNGQVRVK